MKELAPILVAFKMDKYVVFKNKIAQQIIHSCAKEQKS